MAKIVAGLFDSEVDAQHVASLLGSGAYGLGPEDVRLITPAMAAENDTARDLASMGIAQKEAQAYGEGVRRGGSLVAVKVSDPYTGPIREIMSANHAIDVDQRTMEGQPDDAVPSPVSPPDSAGSQAAEPTIDPRSRGVEREKRVDEVQGSTAVSGTAEGSQQVIRPTGTWVRREE